MKKFNEDDIIKELQKIHDQIDQAPLDYEKAKQQFVENTKKLGLKHAFTFDEAWENLLQIREKIKFRNYITKLEEEMQDNPNCLTGKEMVKLNPLKHSFADGCYIREVFNPAGEFIVTKIHKVKHPFFLMKGKMSILTEKGIEHIEAPYHGITTPGTKRIIHSHTDCVFITVHATKHTDIKTIEKEIIAESFNDSAIKQEDLKHFKKLLKSTNKKQIN